MTFCVVKPYSPSKVQQMYTVDNHIVHANSVKYFFSKYNYTVYVKDNHLVEKIDRFSRCMQSFLRLCKILTIVFCDT